MALDSASVQERVHNPALPNDTRSNMSLWKKTRPSINANSKAQRAVPTMQEHMKPEEPMHSARALFMHGTTLKTETV